MHAWRFYVDREIVDGEGGDHIRVIDVPANDVDVAAANEQLERLVDAAGPTFSATPLHEPAERSLEDARLIAEGALEPHEVIGSVASITVSNGLDGLMEGALGGMLP